MPPVILTAVGIQSHLMPPVILTAVGIQSPFDAPRHSHRSGNPEPFRCADTVMATKIRQVGGQAFPVGQYSSGWANHSLGVPKPITGAPSASGIPRQNPSFHQVRNVSQRGILRTLCNLCPSRRSEIAFKVVEQLVDDQPLAFIERSAGDPLPKPGFLYHSGNSFLCALYRPAQTGYKPVHPLGNIGRPLLGPFQDAVILTPLPLYLEDML